MKKVNIVFTIVVIIVLMVHTFFIIKTINNKETFKTNDLNNGVRTKIIEKHICSDDSVDQRSDFILTCIKNANSKSDEEPEDWIRLCQKMAEETYCPIKQYEVTEKCFDYSSIFGCEDFTWKIIESKLIE